MVLQSTQYLSTSEVHEMKKFVQVHIKEPNIYQTSFLWFFDSPVTVSLF